MKKPTTTARLNEMLQQLLDLQARTDTLEIQLDITNDFVWAVCAMVDPLLSMAHLACYRLRAVRDGA